MSEASTVEPWLLLGAVPEKPMYVAASGTAPLLTIEAVSSTTGSYSLDQSVGGFLGYSGTLVGFLSANVVKSSPGMFYEAIVSNALGTATFFQLFNRTTTPPDGTSPLMSFYVDVSSTISVSPRMGHHFDTGITWGWSTRYDYFTGTHAGNVICYSK